MEKLKKLGQQGIAGLEVWVKNSAESFTMFHLWSIVAVVKLQSPQLSQQEK
jgi:hypothetical protein